MLLKKFSLPFSSSTPTSTPPPLPQERLEAINLRRDVTSRLSVAFASHHKTASKKRSNPEGESVTPLQWIGEEMSKGGEDLGAISEGDDALAEYGTVLQQVGEAHSRLATLKTKYLDALAASFLASLSNRLEDHKEFDKAVKEADKIRSALEAVLLKIQKAKKDKPELEEELEKAEREYEDVCDALDRKASVLEGSVGRDVAALGELLDAEVEYAAQYASILADLKSEWPSSVRAPVRRTTLQIPIITRMSRSKSDTSVMNVPPPSAPPRAKAGERRSTIGNSEAPSSLGKTGSFSPGRSGSISRPASRDGKESPAKGRSRSGSLLSRFVAGGKKNSKGEVEKADDDVGEQEDNDADSYTSSTSRRTLPSMPTLPTLGNFKMLGSSSPRYDSISDEPSSIAAARPKNERTQTAPPTSRPSLGSIVGSRFEAKWAFETHDDGELPMEKGAVVVIDREVNSEWWIATIVEGVEEGRKGMFPAAFVVPVVATVGRSGKRPPPPPPSRRVVEAESPFE